jgi:hypothetical protein
MMSVGGTYNMAELMKTWTIRQKLEHIVSYPPALKDYGNSKIVKEALLELLDRIEALEVEAPDLEDLT